MAIDQYYYRGALVAREGEDRPVELASLSKMITAVCVAQAVTAERLTYDDTLGELLAVRRIRSIFIALLKEALAVAEARGIHHIGQSTAQT